MGKGVPFVMVSAKGRKRSSIQIVVESFLHLSILPLTLALLAQVLAMATQELQLTLDPEAMKALENIADPTGGALLLALLFLVLALIRALYAFQNREKEKGRFPVFWVQAGIFLIGAMLPLFFGFNSTVLSILSALYALAMIMGRIVSIVQDHRSRNVVLNSLCIIALLFCAFTFIATDMLIFFLAVLTLMKIIFFRINLAVLWKIIRNTYAAEIIFGLMLLIITFSFLLYYFEPGIESIKDALWYCFAIVTTIGFGDLTAVTDFGRILSVILGAYGIVVVALITSIIVNLYGEMKKDGGSSEEGDAHGA